MILAVIFTICLLSKHIKICLYVDMSIEFDSLINLLRAAGEPTRLRIIALLANGEMVAQEITNILGQSQPRVSNHLKLLHEAGLIEKRAEGSWVFHKLTENPQARILINTIMELMDSNNIQIMKDIEKFLDIRIKREEQAKSYFEKVAPEWETLRALHQPEEGVSKAMLELIGGRKFKFHLDLGAGLGSVLEGLSDISEASEGIDRSHKMLAMARVRLEKFGGKIRVRHGDIFSLPHDSEIADLVSIHQVLHYLEDPKAALKEAIRVLSPNGVLLIAEFAPHNNEELRTEFGHKRLGLSTKDINAWCIDFGLVPDGEILVASDKSKNSKNALQVNVLSFTKPAKAMKMDNVINPREYA